MKKSVLFSSAGCVAAIIIAWSVGVRIFVIQPIGAIPDGVTVIVFGVPNLQFVDSPDAVCQRTQGGVSLLCRGMTAAAIANRGKILARLPYSGILFRLSGAPVLDR
ncbi:hypothetical protein NKI51_30450 [Mesorhizobium australicum]|uniref:hypothetical protein n=1 Tax=Mesorhizobium australicum TaxID=536018 RepID=UPI00333A7FA6